MSTLNISSASAEKPFLNPILKASPEELVLLNKALTDQQNLVSRLWSTFRNRISGYIKRGSGLELRQITTQFFSVLNKQTTPDDKKKLADSLRTAFSTRMTRILGTSETEASKVEQLFKKFIAHRFSTEFELSDERAASVFSEIDTLLGILPPPTVKESPKPFYSKISTLLTSRNIKILYGTSAATLVTGFGVSLLYPLITGGAEPTKTPLSDVSSLVCILADKVPTLGTCAANFSRSSCSNKNSRLSRSSYSFKLLRENTI